MIDDFAMRHPRQSRRGPERAVRVNGAASGRAPGVAPAAALFTALSAAMLVGGCATRTPETGADADALELEPVSAERARVTVGIKAALLSAPDVDAAAIGVRLDGEAVRLEGFVDSEVEHERALAVARQAAQGREVVDELEVR